MNPESWTKNFRGFIMSKRHTLEERLKAIQMVQSGYSMSQVSRELGINDHYVAEWVESYRLEGVEGLVRRPYKEWSFEERCKLISEILEKGVSLHLVSARYGVSQTALHNWLKKVRKGGYDALREIKRKGRPPKDMGRPRKKEPETELEKLRAENERLRTENALLKKVQALVAERIAREEGSGRKPSSH